MQSLRYFQDQLEKKLNEKNAVTDLIAKVEEKTKVNRLYLAYGCIAALVLYLVVGYGSIFLSNFIGFLYPAYASIKAIETKVKDDDTKWLTYWVVFAAISLIEVVTDTLLFWIPFYSLLKCILFLYLMSPVDGNGSILLYRRVIRPYFLKYESSIDQSVDRVSDYATSALNKAKAAAELAGVDGKAD